jgi:hypothetical protein
MPLGMSELKKLDLYEMVNLKNKLDYSNLTYTYSLNLAMFNLLTYLSKPIYLIGFNNNLPT